MTINEIASAINERAAADTGSNAAVFINDFSGVYDISRDEAERIAERANSLDEFECMWRDEDWWSDENN